MTAVCWNVTPCSLVYRGNNILQEDEDCNIFRNSRTNKSNYPQSHKFITPCNRDVLEKLTVSQPVNKFSAFYKSRSFMPCSQEAATCPYHLPDQFTPPNYFIKVRFDITLSSNIRSSKWSLSSGSSSQAVPK